MSTEAELRIQFLRKITEDSKESNEELLEFLFPSSRFATLSKIGKSEPRLSEGEIDIRVRSTTNSDQRKPKNQFVNLDDEEKNKMNLEKQKEVQRVFEFVEDCINNEEFDAAMAALLTKDVATTGGLKGKQLHDRLIDVYIGRKDYKTAKKLTEKLLLREDAPSCRGYYPRLLLLLSSAAHRYPNAGETEGDPKLFLSDAKSMIATLEHQQRSLEDLTTPFTRHSSTSTQPSTSSPSSSSSSSSLLSVDYQQKRNLEVQNYECLLKCYASVYRNSKNEVGELEDDLRVVNSILRYIDERRNDNNNTQRKHDVIEENDDDDFDGEEDANNDGDNFDMLMMKEEENEEKKLRKEIREIARCTFGYEYEFEKYVYDLLFRMLCQAANFSLAMSLLPIFDRYHHLTNKQQKQENQQQQYEMMQFTSVFYHFYYAYYEAKVGNVLPAITAIKSAIKMYPNYYLNDSDTHFLGYVYASMLSGCIGRPDLIDVARGLYLQAIHSPTIPFRSSKHPKQSRRKSTTTNDSSGSGNNSGSNSNNNNNNGDLGDNKIEELKMMFEKKGRMGVTDFVPTLHVNEFVYLMYARIFSRSGDKKEVGQIIRDMSKHNFEVDRTAIYHLQIDASINSTKSALSIGEVNSSVGRQLPHKKIKQQKVISLIDELDVVMENMKKESLSISDITVLLLLKGGCIEDPNWSLRKLWDITSSLPSSSSSSLSSEESLVSARSLEVILPYFVKDSVVMNDLLKLMNKFQLAWSFSLFHSFLSCYLLHSNVEGLRVMIGDMQKQIISHRAQFGDEIPDSMIRLFSDCCIADPQLWNDCKVLIEYFYPNPVKLKHSLYRWIRMFEKDLNLGGKTPTFYHKLNEIFNSFGKTNKRP